MSRKASDRANIITWVFGLLCICVQAFLYLLLPPRRH